MNSEKKVDVSTQGLFAFWKNDTFPYLLGGNVTRMDYNGRVETSEYGKNHWFLPVKILPKGAGENLLAKLKELETERRASLDTFNEGWRKRLRDTIPCDLVQTVPKG